MQAKVGHPGNPVASAERGRHVIVRKGSAIEVGDQDFTKYSLIPSVAFFLCTTGVTNSWYNGNVYVLLKEAAFELSSAVRHACELSKTTKSKNVIVPPIMFLYTDSGPNHKLGAPGIGQMHERMDEDYEKFSPSCN